MNIFVCRTVDGSWSLAMASNFSPRGWILYHLTQNPRYSQSYWPKNDLSEFNFSPSSARRIITSSSSTSWSYQSLLVVKRTSSSYGLVCSKPWNISLVYLVNGSWQYSIFSQGSMIVKTRRAFGLSWTW